MKLKIVLLLIGSLIFLSCRSVYDSSATNIDNIGKNRGVVSHKFRSKGCKTIILVIGVNEDVNQIIIPINGLEKKFDKNNLKITFDYLPLKIKQPDSCYEGIPAEISNVAISRN